MLPFLKISLLICISVCNSLFFILFVSELCTMRGELLPVIFFFFNPRSLCILRSLTQNWCSGNIYSNNKWRNEANIKSSLKYHSNNCCSLYPLVDAEITKLTLSKKGYLPTPKVSPPRFIHCKGKNDLTLEGHPADITLTNQSRLTSPVRGHNSMQPLKINGWGTHGMFLPKKYNFNPIIRKHQKNPNWGAICKTTDRYASVGSKSQKIRRWRTVTDETLRQN